MTAGLLLLALCYAGLCGLCLAMTRHHRQCWGYAPSRARALTLRLGGSLALTAAVALAVAVWGAGEGTVAAFTGAGVAGWVLALVFSYWPRPAASLGLVLPVVASIVHFVRV